MICSRRLWKFIKSAHRDCIRRRRKASAIQSAAFCRFLKTFLLSGKLLQMFYKMKCLKRPYSIVAVYSVPRFRVYTLCTWIRILALIRLVELQSSVSEAAAGLYTAATVRVRKLSNTAAVFLHDFVFHELQSTPTEAAVDGKRPSSQFCCSWCHFVDFFCRFAIFCNWLRLFFKSTWKKGSSRIAPIFRFFLTPGYPNFRWTRRCAPTTEIQKASNGWHACLRRGYNLHNWILNFILSNRTSAHSRLCKIFNISILSLIRTSR